MSEHIQKRLIPPPAQAPLVLVKTKESYQVWHRYLVNIKRVDRYTIGARVDELFLSFLEQIFRASFSSDKFEKLSCISSAIAKGDLLAFILQITWEEKIIDSKKYSKLILNLDEIGRMLGGWKRTISSKTPSKR